MTAHLTKKVAADNVCLNLHFMFIDDFFLGQKLEFTKTL